MEKKLSSNSKGSFKNLPYNSCTKRFLQTIQFSEHFDTIQKEKKKHRCGSCEKLFSRNYSLKKHIHSVH